MLTPNFGSSEYLDATTFNFLSAAVTTSLQQIAATSMTPGLVMPEGLRFQTTGLQIAVTCPITFGIVFSNGTLAQAVGSVPGSTNGNYTVNFAPLVPTIGSTTAYLLCQVSQVGQTPVTVTGPPPGHPDWNPQFSPYTLYTVTQDSLAMTASLAPPDNLTTFSLGTLTLSVGMTVLPTLDQRLLYRAGSISARPVEQRSGNWNFGTDSQGVIQNITGASIFTLPPAFELNGMEFEFTGATQSAVTIQSQGADVIWGSGTTSVTSLTLPQGSSAKFVAQNASWYIMSSSPNLGGGGGSIGPTGPINYVINLNNPPSTYINMALNDTLYISFSNVTQVPTFVNTLGGTFRVIICLSGVSSVNNDLFWLANNQFYPGNSPISSTGSFTTWCAENSDAPNPWDTNFTPQGAPAFLSSVAQTFVSTQYGDNGVGGNLGWFAMDAFGDGARPDGDNINDLGPCMWDVLLCTSTPCKMVKFNGGVAGGCGIGFSRWFDTTTPWSLLGTFGIGADLSAVNPSSITGFAYVQCIGQSISVG